MDKSFVFSKRFVYKGDNDKGVVSFLRNSKNKNAIFENIILTNSSFTYHNDARFNIYAPLGINNTYAWHSRCEENSWLMISFPNFKMLIDSYSMKSHKTYPTSWCLEARNPGDNEWTNVSFVKDRVNISESLYEHVNCTKTSYFSEYKIKMLGKRTTVNDYCFEICRLEFFGTIMTPFKQYSCICRRNAPSHSFIYVMISFIS